MKYVIEGIALENVLRENRIRIAKGELIVTPFDEAVPVEEGKDVVVEDSKDVMPTDTESPKKASKKTKK
jgi:hypothetical protein